jgi:hypothetical protein
VLRAGGAPRSIGGATGAGVLVALLAASKRATPAPVAAGVTFPPARRSLRVRIEKAARASAVVAALATVLLGTGCSGGNPLPARAATMESVECRDTAPAQEELGEVERMTVLTARPACHLNYCSGVFQVMGVKLVVRPPEGATLDQFARTLRCHNLRALDGALDASRIPDDPYTLTDSWLDIDVKAEGGNYVVTLNGDRVSDNLRILHRAQAFAATHGPTPR